MVVSVIQVAKRLLKLPKVKWVLFFDNIQGLYCPNQKEILIDCINEQSFYRRSTCLLHEFLHHVFNIFFDEKFYEIFSRILDITDGNQPELIHERGSSVTVVIHIFD